ncbi:unnamed protein product [Microthlaspi erraticum]|uniref:glucan endo-1,3-beta-D-glucosidase n=1 Tax=Microthlaspi erraticum TaxID=1685480 RepID=A0A6D2IB07_9BRAS|nr:unnamed protein product [Microthlaspi erraticum]CAA7056101.1 unnamed protein product [Microthlaspi erraticum]
MGFKTGLRQKRFSRRDHLSARQRRDDRAVWLAGVSNRTGQGSGDTGADFGIGIYNDHHYHLGYFLYAIAVLAKMDPLWGKRYRPDRPQGRKKGLAPIPITRF